MKKNASTAPPRPSILVDLTGAALSPSGMATIAGGICLAATTHCTIVHSGGYATANAPMIAAMSLGVFAGARALGAGHKGLGRIAAVLLVAMACGEAYNFLATAETTVVSRNKEAAPLRAAQERHDKAAKRLDDLMAATGGTPPTARLSAAQAALTAAQAARPESQRVQTARKTLADAKADVAAEAANGGCRSACKAKQDDARRAQAAIDTASAADASDQLAAISRAEAEVQAALAAADTDRRAEIEQARADLKAAPKPESATALADSLDVSATKIDLLVALLRSLGVNMLAGALIALGSHMGRKTDPAQTATPVAPVAPVAELAKPTPPTGPRGPGKRGRRRDATVVSFVERHRQVHGRSPTIPEMRAEFPGLNKSTLWRNAQA